MKKVLITGGAGFIGANLANRCLTQGCKVIIYDNLFRKHVEANLDWLKEHKHAKNLEIVTEDIRDKVKLDTEVKKADTIFHEAGQTAVTTSIKNPAEDFEINAWGTFNLLESVREFNPEALVCFASTNKVYGNLHQYDFEETENAYVLSNFKGISEAEPLDFYSPYGCSKGTADQYVHDYSRSFGLRTMVFRQSCIYGDHQFGVEDQGWVAHFMLHAMNNKPITIFGNGKQVRDILYISDLVDLYLTAAKHPEKTGIYNVGGGLENATSLLSLIDQLQEIIGTSISLKFGPERVGDQVYYVSDISKAKKTFSWKPQIAIPDGLEKLHTWLKTWNASR